MRLVASFRRRHTVTQSIQVVCLDCRVVLLLRLCVLALLVTVMRLAWLVVVRRSVQMARAVLIVRLGPLVDRHVLMLLLIRKFLHVGRLEQILAQLSHMATRLMLPG